MKPFTIFSIALLITIVAAFFATLDVRAETCPPGYSFTEIQEGIAKSAEKNKVGHAVKIEPLKGGQRSMVVIYSDRQAAAGVFSKDGCLIRARRTVASDEMARRFFGKTMAELFPPKPAPLVDS